MFLWIGNIKKEKDDNLSSQEPSLKTENFAEDSIPDKDEFFISDLIKQGRRESDLKGEIKFVGIIQNKFRYKCTICAST